MITRSGRPAEPDEPLRVADFDALDEPGGDGSAIEVRVASFDVEVDVDDGGDVDGGGEQSVAGGVAPPVHRADLDGPADEDGSPVRIASFEDDIATGSDPVPRRARFDGPAGAGASRRVPAATGDATDRSRRRRTSRDGAPTGPDATGESVDPGRPDIGTGTATRDRGRAGTRGTGGARSVSGPGRRAGGRSRDTGPATPAEEESRAKEICLRLLTDRARTVKELRDALVRKEVPDDVADRVLERFDEVGLVDDEAFAGQWVRSRHRHRGLGKRAIAQELRRKGVAKEIADEALSEIDPESEEARARELVDRKLRTLKVGTKEERATAARRLVGMLARKGYGGGVAYSVVREAIAARGAESDELGEDVPDD